MILIQYEDMTIEIYSDSLYSSFSTDNTIQYDAVYSVSMDRQYESYSPKYGIMLKDNQGDVIKSVIIVGSAVGCTTPHENSALLDIDNLIIVVGNSTFCLNLPSLNFKWKAITENSYTCFSVHSLNDRYVIHAEGSIIFLNKTGEVYQEFTGRDIFVTLEGIDDFIIKEDMIIAKDFEGNIYMLNAEGTEVK